MSLRVCYNIFIPLRESPSHRAEMTNQLLFGERFGITDTVGNWLRIVSLFDSFSGWIDNSQAVTGEWAAGSKGIVTGKIVKCVRPDKSIVHLMPGSEIHNLDFSTGIFKCNGETLQLYEKPFEDSVASAGSPLESALQFINVPYLWGGRTPGGIDCSGLIQTVFKIHGVALPRNSYTQAESGEAIDFFEESQPGDLLFFSGEGDTISHVGILASPGKLLHASGSVKIDAVDHQGIWSDTHENYTHNLRIIKRITL